MNKYQEALDLKLEERYIIDLHLEKFPETQEALYKNEEFKKNIEKKERFCEKYKDYPSQFLQELVDKHEKLEQENFDLRQKLNNEEYCCAMLEKKVKKLKSIIQILNRIYGFKLQDIKYSGFYELLIPDMTSDELTKEEYELLQEEIEER